MKDERKMDELRESSGEQSAGSFFLGLHGRDCRSWKSMQKREGGNAALRHYGNCDRLSALRRYLVAR
jgi:hypothetical protein